MTNTLRDELAAVIEAEALRFANSGLKMHGSRMITEAFAQAILDEAINPILDEVERAVSDIARMAEEMMTGKVSKLNAIILRCRQIATKLRALRGKGEL